MQPHILIECKGKGKCKVVPVVNYAPPYEGELGEWSIAPSIL